MDQFLLDTNFVSVLYDPRRPNHKAVTSRAGSFLVSDRVFLSSIVLGELRYGIEAARRAGQSVDHIQRTLEKAAKYPLAEVGRHTAEAYGEVKARLADYYMNLTSKPPRWLEDWQIHGSSKTLQVDENDLWLVAQAFERNYVLLTTDSKLAERFCPSIAELRVELV
jgi:tRNA(fMet)-specific endonuclease VapC